MKELMREIGDVGDRDDQFFEVYSDKNLGAGVEINSDPVRIKITVEWQDAMLLPHHDSNDVKATLRIDHAAGTFNALVRKSANRWDLPRARLAVWKPEDPVDEELMQKCVSFVSAVFSHA